MSEKPLRLAVIIGSVRQGRFGSTIAHWFVNEARQRPDFDIDLIDLADISLPMTLPKSGVSPSVSVKVQLEKISPRLAAADAFVIVTPEYNHSFPASLKNVIDWHYREWHAKPVGFVSYGGLSGGLRAVEQLRLVFGELHAVTLRDTISFHQIPSPFDDKGNLDDPDHWSMAAKILLDHILWWGKALREARALRPYSA